MAGQLRAPLFIVESLPEGTVSVRADYVAVEPLADSSGTLLRANYVLVEPLVDMFRQLRCSYICIESLYPVLPEGHVSTELFPGSLGSAVALPGLQWPIGKRPTWSTTTYKGQAGTSVRRANMQYPVWEFDLSFELLRDSVNQEFQALLDFFLARRGSFDTFLFKDRDDYQVTGGLLGTADGVTTQFDFRRRFGTSGTFYEKVGQVDVGNIVNVYDNGVLKTAGTYYNIVLPNHVVFVTAPTAGHLITADFQFFFNCKFQDDTADFAKFAETFWELQKVVLETVPQ